MSMMPQNPVGIFDSGIGGLTVAYAVKNLLPTENIVYFGDTAHLPYGDKSEAAIQAYAVKIADVLLQKGCKVIVIACNSASSAATELLNEYVNKEVKVINVIDPMIDLIEKGYPGKHVGLIGTRRTVQSGVYKAMIEGRGSQIDVSSLATPLLAPMIEDGFFNNQISYEIINQYLSSPDLDGIEALILACTHYPLIKKEISAYYNHQLPILDSAEVVAQALKTYLENEKMLNPSGGSGHHFFVSDYTVSFEASTKIFFREPAPLEKLPLWR